MIIIGKIKEYNPKIKSVEFVGVGTHEEFNEFLYKLNIKYLQKKKIISEDSIFDLDNVKSIREIQNT